jgi:hypothetical protein
LNNCATGGFSRRAQLHGWLVCFFSPVLPSCTELNAAISLFLLLLRRLLGDLLLPDEVYVCPKLMTSIITDNGQKKTVFKMQAENKWNTFFSRFLVTIEGGFDG